MRAAGAASPTCPCPRTDVSAWLGATRPGSASQPRGPPWCPRCASPGIVFERWSERVVELGRVVRRRTARWFAVIGLLLSLLLVSTVGSAAQTTGTPIATGLSSPFFVTVGDDGMVYTVDAGSGQGRSEER